MTVLSFTDAWAKRHPGEQPYAGPAAATLAVKQVDLAWSKGRVICKYTLSNGVVVQAIMSVGQAKVLSQLLEERANAAEVYR